MWEQFLQLINGLEDGDSKTNLLAGFTKIKQDNDTAILARDTAKGDNKPMKELLEALKGASGLDELNADTLKDLIKSKSKAGETDEIKAVNDTLNELREKYSTLETTHSDFVTSSKDKAFELALSQSDIFKDVSSDPFLRNAVIGKVKPKLIIGDDGKIYAKGDDGKILKDIVSGKPIEGSTLFSGMVKSGDISKAAIVSSVIQGTGSPQGKPVSGDTSTMSASQMMKAGRAS